MLYACEVKASVVDRKLNVFREILLLFTTKHHLHGFTACRQSFEFKTVEADLESENSVKGVFRKNVAKEYYSVKSFASILCACTNPSSVVCLERNVQCSFNIGVISIYRTLEYEMWLNERHKVNVVLFKQVLCSIYMTDFTLR